MYVWIALNPISRATLAAAAYRIEQAFLVPSVTKRVTSAISYCGSARATGRPTIAAPRSSPAASFTPIEKRCPTTGLWCRC